MASANRERLVDADRLVVILGDRNFLVVVDLLRLVVPHVKLPVVPDVFRQIEIVRCFEGPLDADVVMESCFWYAFAADERARVCL